jgi:hypothetical protein
MSGACSAHGDFKILIGSLQGRDRSENLGVGGGIILKGS